LLAAGPAWTTTSDGSQDTPRQGAPDGWQARAGSTPPQLLHEQLVRDAEEVLVLTHACDLAFVEDVCVRQARAGGARVTVVYDANAGIDGSDPPRPPVRDYVPVPVLCRSGGAFHPKLVVTASATDAVVSIGSGNATEGGWRDRAEVWTHLRAAGPTVPLLFGDLADWLRRLPGLLWIDALGAERLNAVADLLAGRPVAAEPDEPMLLTNDLDPIVDQLPFPGGGVDRLSVAAPFFDPAAEGLTALIGGLRPAELRLVLTHGAHGDPAALTRALATAGTARVQTPRDPGGAVRHHGKIVEWWAGQSAVVVSGSPDCTPAALLRTSADPGGNCELALLHETTTSVIDALDPVDTTLDSLGLGAAVVPSAAAPPTRVLTARIVHGRIEVTTLGTAPASLVVGSSTLLPTGGDGELRTFAADESHETRQSRTADVHTGDGELLGTVLVTDAGRALTRIARPSPLEQRPLAALIADEQQLNALFDALTVLAGVRVEAVAGEPATQRRAREEDRIRGAVGPALLDLALGRDATALDHPDAIEGLDDQRRDRLRQQVIGLALRSGGWPLPARLAAFRVVLVFTAAGLWPQAEDWTPIVAGALGNLLSVGSEAFGGEHAALATIGLVAVQRGYLSFGPATPDDFEKLRDAGQLGEAPDRLVDRYAAGLAGGAFGPRFAGDDIRADAEGLLSRSPFDEAVDAIPESVGTVARTAEGGVTVEALKDSRKTALLVLDLLRDFPDTHVAVQGASGVVVHGWWNGRRLLLATRTGGLWRAMLWPSLFTGIATYARATPLPAAGRSWQVTSAAAAARDAGIGIGTDSDTA
jgi:hypothetical protein